jgi:hypothetical protein
MFMLGTPICASAQMLVEHPDPQYWYRLSGTRPADSPGGARGPTVGEDVEAVGVVAVRSSCV